MLHVTTAGIFFEIRTLSLGLSKSTKQVFLWFSNILWNKKSKIREHLKSKKMSKTEAFPQSVLAKRYSGKFIGEHQCRSAISIRCQ